MTNPKINASAVYNPRAYSIQSAKFSHVHNVSNSISGDAATRRLLRGKRDFFQGARKMVNSNVPLWLEGHSVPPQLLQHFVDLADQLLWQYDTDECSFHN